MFSALPAMAQMTTPVLPNDPARALPPSASPAGSLLGALSNDAAAGPSPVERRARFTLNRVEFVGAQAASPEALGASWERYRGQPVSLADLRAIAAEVEGLYADMGRPFVAVVLLPQRVEDGVVRYDVVEGRITDLTVLGSDPVARRQARAVLAPLVERQPLTLSDVERAYELSRGVPGLAVSGALRRGSKPGGMDLVVQAERQAWRSYGNVNNLYADPVGPWGALVGADYFGASRYGDQTSAQVFSTLEFGEQEVFRVSHSRRLNPHGTTVAVTGIVADAEPEGDISALNLATEVTAGRLELTHPIVQRTAGFLLAGVALDASDQKTRVRGSDVLSDDRLRVLSLTLAGEHRGSVGSLLRDYRAAGSVEARQGLEAFGASEPGDDLLSRADADPQAFLIRGRFEGEAAVNRWVRLVARLEGQRTEDSLASPEEYSVGNLSIGRGYAPGSLFGDSALAGSLEVRLGPYGLPRLGTWRLRAQPFAFYDHVRVWNEDADGVDGRAIASSGYGVRFELPGRFRLDLLYAEPRDPPLGLGESEPQPGVYMNLTAGLNDVFDSVRRRLRPMREAR